MYNTMSNITPESRKLTISLQELNLKLGGKQDIYSALSKKYYLPASGSKALTGTYIEKYLIAGPPILKLERSKMHFIQLPRLQGQANIDNILLKF